MNTLREKTIMTNQYRMLFRLLEKDLKHEEAALVKAKTLNKSNLPGIKRLIKRHESGVKQTRLDLLHTKVRIKKYEKEGKINKILH